MSQDYYSVLGVTRTASVTEIKKAYREKARIYHPDVNDSPEAATVFHQVSIAYEVLSDAQKRDIYDRGGDPMNTRGHGAGYASPFSGFGGIGDIFDAFFGAGSTPAGPTQSRVRRGNDALLKINITMEESYTGVVQDITVDTAVLCQHCGGTGSESHSHPVTCSICAGQGQVQRIQQSLLGQIQVLAECPRCAGTGEIVQDPCEFCSGNGRVKDRETLEVNIPAGINSGMRIKKTGAGEIGPGGGEPGDLYIEVTVDEHDYFTRQDYDLNITVSLPLPDAVLGSELDVLSLVQDTMTITIPAGTASGSTIVVPGAGMPHINSDGSGDLLVHVVLNIPENPDTEEKNLWQQIKKKQKTQPEILTREPEKHGFFSRKRSKKR